MRWPLAIIAAAVTVIGLGSQADAQCLEADRDELAIGNLAHRVFKDAAGRPEPSFILMLPEPVCLNGEEDTDNVSDARTIHIVSGDESMERTIRRFVGTSVQVLGKPYGALTVHHHAPIVMPISEIDTYPVSTTGARRIVQPERGSKLRAELLDAVRPVFVSETGGPVEFVVKRLNVMGDWAFGEVRLQRPGGQPIDWKKTIYAEDFEAGMFDPDGSDFLLRRSTIGWVVMEFATGPTDVAWDSWRHDYRLPLALFQR